MERIVLVLASLLLVCQCFIPLNAQINKVGQGCEGYNFNYTDGSVYERNLNLVFKNLTSKSGSLKFYNFTVGDGSNKVYGLFQCRYDFSLEVCKACVQDASQVIIQECPFYGEANIWYKQCMLRYANRNIFSLYDISFEWDNWSLANVSNYEKFAPILANAMNGLIKNTSSALPYFASGETNLTLFDNLYTLAQCTPDIRNFECNNCLKTALSRMINCCKARQWVRVFLPSCQLWYDTITPILNYTGKASPDPPPHIDEASGPSEKSSLKPAIIAAIVAGISVGLVVLVLVLWICFYRRKSKDAGNILATTSSRELHDGIDKSYQMLAYNVDGDTDSLGNSEFVEYELVTLKNATRDFSDENMLGKGGFGIVYKGISENGQQLAIKRLSVSTSGQGMQEFMAEARLLAKLQHRNLVKILGFCSHGVEKILVYEYMSNSSLDRFLFDPAKRPLLDWTTRFKIVMGIARGLQYLHEDSRLTIIHRDLKPGNILLDSEMNPKIADFGMAKLFEVEQKYGSTSRVIGTIGYMAPEYVMSGEYSEKSDVYSFGIMLLEIVSGKKNIITHHSPRNEDLPIHAWRLWNQRQYNDLIDPTLCKNSSNEVMRCIQIGLLCVQTNAEKRPTMGLVVFMLNGFVDLPLPSAPMMSSHQSSMTNSNSGDQPSDPDQPSAKSVTWRAELDRDLYPKPR